MEFKHLILAALVTPICCSCSLNVANGMLAYDTGDTRVSWARTMSKDAKGDKVTSSIFDTRGSVNLVQPAVDEKIVLIYDIMKSAPGMFERSYLLTQEVEQLRKVLAMIEKSKKK